MTPRETVLREDLTREYYALVDAVAGADGRLIIVKGWSVTLSLAALGLGFQQQHYALFGLGAATAAAFWFLDGLMKGHQVRYYGRHAGHRGRRVRAQPRRAGAAGERSHLPASTCPGPSAARPEQDGRTDPPQRRTPDQIRLLLRGRFVLPNVMFPHVLAVLLGAALFLAAASDAWGLAPLDALTATWGQAVSCGVGSSSRSPIRSWRRTRPRGVRP